jgi:hypothetical protein
MCSSIEEVEQGCINSILSSFYLKHSEQRDSWSSLQLDEDILMLILTTH